MMNDTPLTDIDRLAQTLWDTRFCIEDPHRLPKQIAFLVAALGSRMEQAQAGRYTQAELVSAVTSKLEVMQAVGAAIKRP